jgi:hypothetical protein
VADIATQDEAFRLLKEGARLLYTSAAGQPVQLGDVNAWFEQFNQLVQPLQLGDTYGVINEPEPTQNANLRGLLDHAAELIGDADGQKAQWLADYRDEISRIPGARAAS